MTEPARLSPLDTHFADFIVRMDSRPGDELWWGAALASYSAGRGHTCFDLADSGDIPALPLRHHPRKSPPSDISGWTETLKTCDTVGAPGAYTPLILDRSGRLYLHRCWEYERQVAAGVLSRSMALEVDENRLDAALERYFPGHGGEADLQREAARVALTRRFSVISGGPGTGKTATVARILALLLDTAEGSCPEIVLAAPTGKAASRLHQSVLQAVDRLALPDDIKKALPTAVSTIHRLLGVQPRTAGFRHKRGNPLSCGVLVVDEASMVDLQLMASLLEALHDDARVILLGDRNQLASVEAGAVLADICDSAGRGPVPVTQLTRSYRFSADSGIAALSQVINRGDGTAAVGLLKAGRHQDITWRQLPSGRGFDAAFSSAVQAGYAAYLAADSPAAALAGLDSFRVLSPLRSGTYGVDNLNRLCLDVLDPAGRSGSRHIRRMPVMITGNDYELGLFNGDTGVIMESGGEPAVWFEDPEGGLRHLSPLRLPPGEIAFALTVHKSQGSEFDRVLLILPDHLSEVLSRELLYTAVTRARGHIEIWGSEEVFRQTVERYMLRNSGLRDRLTGDGA